MEQEQRGQVAPKGDRQVWYEAWGTADGPGRGFWPWSPTGAGVPREAVIGPFANYRRGQVCISVAIPAWQDTEWGTGKGVAVPTAVFTRMGGSLGPLADVLHLTIHLGHQEPTFCWGSQDACVLPLALTMVSTGVEHSSLVGGLLGP